MREILRRGGVRVVLGEASLGGRPFDGRREEDIASLARAAGWAGNVQTAVQVHGIRIAFPGECGEADAFLVRPGGAAAIRVADCWPVVVADPDRGEAVVAHCGWRGALAGLAGRSVRLLAERGSDPGALRASIGPGIAPESFEVGPEVTAAFPAASRSSTSWNSPSIDLGNHLRMDLENAGVPASRIDIDRRDTFRDLSLHSYRRDGAHAGRMACLCIVAEVGMIDPSS
ncbi:MAG: polyphenol oxidase family protein [Fibrobacteria bacterium]|nr:polyphenol oxidase family protein [Fibrobacteria bacterium]